MLSLKILSLKSVLLCLTILSAASMAQAAKNTIGILIYDGVLSSDVTAPIEVFGAATKKSWFSDYEIVLISPEKQRYITSEEGLNIKVDHSIKDELDLDVLLVPSTYDMSPLLKNRKLIDFIAAQSREAKWVASNCSGAFLLAEAGILDGLKATTWAGGESDLKSDYPLINVQFDQNVVVDKNIITSNGSVISYQAALVLLEKLSSAAFANEIAESIQWPRLRNAF